MGLGGSFTVHVSAGPSNVLVHTYGGVHMQSIAVLSNAGLACWSISVKHPVSSMHRTLRAIAPALVRLKAFRMSLTVAKGRALETARYIRSCASLWGSRSCMHLDRGPFCFSPSTRAGSAAMTLKKSSRDPVSNTRSGCVCELGCSILVHVGICF